MGRKGIQKRLKIAWLSDFDLIGSGYLNLSAPICEELSKYGHDVKAIGLHYRGDEHYFNFSILPANDLFEAMAITQVLAMDWRFDVLVVALDIMIQEGILQSITQRPFKYVMITPLESPPLCFSWAAVMAMADKVYIISDFGAQEAQQMGIDASPLTVCVDTRAWRRRTDEDKARIREAFGYQEDDFIILTVADNQERKNLAAALEIFRDFAADKPNARYILVTRIDNRVGWRLLDLVNDFRLSDKVRLVERGLPFVDLWGYYAMSDVFMLSSKAEGAGLPLLEAMAVGVPCVGTDWAAIHEHLRDGRGFLVPAEYEFIDPFGNGLRKFIDKQATVRVLNDLYSNGIPQDVVQRAREYVEARKWPVVVSEFERTLREMCDE